MAAQTPSRDSLGGMSYLSNQKIRVGVDLNLGGSITYVADARKLENVVNNKDWGRQVQLSFYSGPVPFEPNGKKANPHWIDIGWNPIQSGDVAGNRSKILAHDNDGKTIYVKCIPMHWPLDNVPGECYFESWVTLDGNAVKVHARLVNSRPDKTQYPAREQELPAVYTNAPYHRLITYRGDKPFTNDTLSNVKNLNHSGDPDIQFQATENWAANVDENNYGLGIWSPGTQRFACGFFGDTFKGDSKSDATGYIAPNQTEVIDHNMVYDFDYTLILGTVSNIRDYVYHHAKKPGQPAFVFKNTRRHWFYENTTDAGWPIKSELAVKLKPKAALISPDIYWKAKDADELTIVAACNSPADSARVYWRQLNNKVFNDSCSIAFKIIPDARYHTYHIRLRNSAFYSGTLAGLKIALNTAADSKSGGMVHIRSIALRAATNKNVSGALNTAKLKQQVHAHLVKRFKDKKIAGAAVLVAQNGKIVLKDIIGYADIEQRRTLDYNDVFRLASMSKPLTAAAILLLVDQKKISLYDPVYKYIPEFKNLKVAVPVDEHDVKNYQPDPAAPFGVLSASSNYRLVPASRPVTIHDLLTHSSGMGEGVIGYTEINKLPIEPGSTLVSYIPKLSRLPLDFQPGTRTGYSAITGFDICGRIIEIVSGHPLDRFMRERILMPLGMKNTGFVKNLNGLKKIVTLCKTTDSGMVKEKDQYPFAIGTTYLCGSAGVVGTIGDYFHFAQMLANGGVYNGRRILSPRIVNQMTSPQLPGDLGGFPTGANWGLSVRVITGDRSANQPLAKKSFGWSGAFGTHFWVDPVNHVVALYFTNIANAGGSEAETARELERDVSDALKQ
ncbi:CubicO group peptidase, beta-lactamase class C family [Mucilaginibacter gossypiicola]|uniref:CubicO group peptidase, beta-lactamase class C family n=2 Tax=Mucilaginibacter gossypiicola TaxID=551995 RepID=A0A1H8BP76_9SPHI|nr:CubicO group peptidase, beta-lactamase class C family [Mucilaginibacter gossypiicola]